MVFVLDDLPYPISELSRHRLAVGPAFSWNARGMSVFFSSRGLITSARSLAATSVPLVHTTHRPPPSATAPHRLPGTWRLRILPATTRIFLVKDVFAPASIPGRHSLAAGSPS